MGFWFRFCMTVGGRFSVSVWEEGRAREYVCVRFPSFFLFFFFLLFLSIQQTTSTPSFTPQL